MVIGSYQEHVYHLQWLVYHTAGAYATELPVPVMACQQVGA